MSYDKNDAHIDRRVFFKEKSFLFKEYAAEYPEKDLLVLFNEWTNANTIYGVDRHKIWKRVRHARGIKTIIIKEGSEGWVRLQAVLDILLDADLKYLHELMEKKYGKKKTAAL